MHLDNILQKDADRKAKEELTKILLDIQKASEPLRILLAKSNVSLYVDIYYSNSKGHMIQTGIPFVQVMGYDEYGHPADCVWGRVLRELFKDHYGKQAAQEFYNTATK